MASDLYLLRQVLRGLVEKATYITNPGEDGQYDTACIGCDKLEDGLRQIDHDANCPWLKAKKVLGE